MLIAELHASGGGESAPPLFVGPNARLLLQGQPDIVQALEQEFAPEIINLEGRQEAGGVANFPLLQVNAKEITLKLGGSQDQFRDFGVAEHHRQHAILDAVGGKNI